jgi:hypothetical protein
LAAIHAVRRLGAGGMPADAAAGVASEGRTFWTCGADVAANAATSAASAARSAVGSAACVLASFADRIIITSQPAMTARARLKQTYNANDTREGRS